MHSRASHTYKVAMVSREIADSIVRRAWNDPDVAAVIFSAGGLDIAACETAGLAHDLGHPPFGHAGEEALDKALREDGADKKPRTPDGFEGNAQSFRIVAALDRVKLLPEFGLDLTNVTLAAILKYPFPRGTPFSDKKNRKWGAYTLEAEELTRVRSAVLGTVPDVRQQTLEASIMDLADDIAYAIHDLEDFFAAGALDTRAILRKLDDAITGVMPLTDSGEAAEGPRFGLSASKDPFTEESVSLREKYEGFFNDDEYFDALSLVQETISEIGDFDKPGDVVALRTALSGIVQQFFDGLVVSPVPPFTNGPLVHLKSQAWHQIQALKVITRHFLVSTPRMGMLQRAQSQTITTLVTQLAAWLLAHPKVHELPIGLRRVMEAGKVLPLNELETVLTAKHYRAIADYICTMSDSEALLRAQWLSGTDHPGTSVTSTWA
jgi:dGTPase